MAEEEEEEEEECCQSETRTIEKRPISMLRNGNRRKEPIPRFEALMPFFFFLLATSMMQFFDGGKRLLRRVL